MALAASTQTPVKRALDLIAEDATPEKLLRSGMTVSNFEQVREFHAAFGIKDQDIAFDNVFKTNPKLVTLRKALVDEEFKELQVAAQEHDLHEVVDALTDILYVVYGAGLAFGVQLDELFAAAAKGQKGALPWSLPSSSETVTGKAAGLLGSNFEKVKSFCAARGLLTKGHPKLDIFKDEKLVSSLLSFVEDSVSIFHKALAEENFEATIASLVLLLFRVYVFGVHLDVDMDKAFAIVHRSNMSKLCKTEAVAETSVAKYSEQWAKGTGKYDVTAYRRSEDGVHWVVYHVTSGKVLKSYLWSSPDFAPLGVQQKQ